MNKLVKIIAVTVFAMLIVFTAAAQNTPAAPGNVRSGTSTHDKITVLWNAVSGSGMSYKVYYHTINNPVLAKSVTATGTNVDITGLAANTRYFVWVSAVQSSREGDLSGSITINTAAPPVVVPSNLRQGTVTHDTITVLWNQVPGPQTSYKVWYGTQNDANRATSVNASGTNVDITGLTAETTYYIWVSTVQGGNESAKSASITVRTSAAPATGPARPR